MPLIRCAACRYSFEHSSGERPETCPQCGRRLEPEAAPKATEPTDNKKTLKMKTLFKPED